MKSEPLAPTTISLDKDFGADIELLMTLVPDRMAFKIGEVADLLGLKPHILRYWESEFDALKPKKSKFNQRFYTKREIELLLVIRKFLYVDKFSISGARVALSKWRRAKSFQTPGDEINKWKEIRKEFQEVIEDLLEIKSQLNLP